MYCICCKKNVVNPYDRKTLGTLGENITEVELLWEGSDVYLGKDITHEMIDNGIIHIIDAGYGSSYDGDRFIIAICDDCISINKNDATLLCYGYDTSDVELSKKLYNRRKNIDNLV